MLTKNKIKLFQSLSKKKFRQKYQLFFAEGEKIVSEIIDSDYQIEYLIASKAWIESSDLHRENAYEIIEASSDEIKKISMLVSPPGVLCIVKIPQAKLEYHTLGNNINLVLDQVKDPGNLGTIIRIADWFGVSNIICSENTADLFNPKVIQATMGSFTRVNVFYTNLNDFILQYKKRYNDHVYATTLNGSNVYQEALSNSGLIIMGSESSGISEDILQQADEKIMIPSFTNGENKTDSLNVAIATSLICSEFRRKYNFR